MRVFHSSPSRCRPLERTTAARTSLFGHRTVRHQSPANAPSPKHSAGDASTAQPWSLTSLREKLIGSGPRSSPTGATSRSRWPRLRCRDRCSVADCPAPSIARAGMSGRQEQNAGRRPQQRHALVRAKQRGSAFRCRQPRASIACCRCRGDLPLPKPVRSAILASKSPESGECRCISVTLLVRALAISHQSVANILARHEAVLEGQHERCSPESRP